jgi:MoaD family protein
LAKVRVKLFTALGGKIVKEDSNFDAADIGQLLEILAQKHGKDFRDEIFEGGEIKNFYILLHNGQVVDRQNPGRVSLNEGDTIHIFPPVSGG